MKFLGDVFDFLGGYDRWHGDESIPVLLGQHLQLTFVSVLLAAAFALPIGLALGHLRKGGAVAINVANIGRALPALALLILAVQWVGIGDPTGIFTPLQSIPAFIAMFALAVPPMLANAYVGVAGIDDEVREAARGMGLTGRQVLTGVELPLALPLVMAGVRTAAVAVVATATLSAYVDAGGLGRYIVDGFAVSDEVRVFAGGLLVALLAIAVELSLGSLQRVLVSPGLRAGDQPPLRQIDSARLHEGALNVP
ncbi:MAG: ABC transporter permease [Acidimicrobiia bacterium]